MKFTMIWNNKVVLGKRAYEKKGKDRKKLIFFAEIGVDKAKNI